jgi:hypothetical protein
MDKTLYMSKCPVCDIYIGELYDHLILRHKFELRKIISIINYLNHKKSESILDIKYKPSSNFIDNFIDSNDNIFDVHNYIVFEIISNLVPYHNICSIAQNIILVYVNDKWLVDINLFYTKKMINFYMDRMIELVNKSNKNNNNKKIISYWIKNSITMDNVIEGIQNIFNIKHISINE